MGKIKKRVREYKPVDEFKGKIAIVTGVSSKRGIGGAVAMALAKKGANLVLLDKYDALPSLCERDEGWKGLSGIAEEIRSLKREAITIKADVSRGREVKAAIKEIIANFGRIDILVNCAGIPGKRDTPVWKLGQRDWENTLSVNLTGSFLTSKYVAESMIIRGITGKIVHISSMRGKVGKPEGAAYAASKFGIIGLVQSLALELAPYKINVNAVCPGFIDTNIRNEWCKEQALTRHISIDEAREEQYGKWRATIPLGRMGTPADVVNVIMFLVSSQSEYMTGQAINITGGVIMH